MAGGFGKRLRPYTDDIPKPMLTVGDKPILENILKVLYHADLKIFHIFALQRLFSFVIILVMVLSGMLTFDIPKKKTPLGTAGALSFDSRTIISPHFGNEW